jgi:adenylate cyclase
VNVAARLEGLAAPGGVCLSEEVHRHLRGKVAFRFEDLGPKALKNIAEPVRAYRVLWQDGEPDQTGAARQPGPAAPVVDMPSIAVLPFDNLSSDSEQAYFADGMVEEIITALSRFKWLLVMARNSSFTYKGRAVDVRQVADELGVRYVLEGSVRRAGQRVRITGQLIDATTGAHIWADRFDGDMEDIFDLQDNVTASVVGAIEPSLRKAEIERSRRKRPDSLAAYDLFLRALTPLNMMRPEANTEALGLLERAITIDPGYAPALAYAAWCYEQRLLHHWPAAQESDAGTGARLARDALAVDSGDAGAIAMAGFVLTMMGHDYDSGRTAAQRALELNPNSATICWMAGWTIMFAGEPDAAFPIFERALRLSPSDPQANFLLCGMAMSHLVSERPAEAFEYASKSIALYPVDVAYYVLVPACGHLGRTEDATAAIARLVALAPGISISNFPPRMPFRDQRHLDIILDGLRKAGLPE